MLRPRRAVTAALLALGLLACQKGEDKKNRPPTADPGPDPGPGPGPGPGGPARPVGDNIESVGILARTQTAKQVDVKHVLIGWKDLAEAYGGQMDERAAKRTEPEARSLAADIAGRMTRENVDGLIKQYSEDPGSLEGKPYTVTPQERFVEPFKNLALRLKIDEVGIVKTDFGYHVMIRLPPPPPPPRDPVESADILDRPEGAGPTNIQLVLLGWKDAPFNTRRPPDPRALARTKEDTDKLVLEVLGKVRGGGDMPAIMKQYSEDKASSQNAHVFEVNSDDPPSPIKDLALRLQLGEAGAVKTEVGWYVVKRVPAPPPAPPDPLDSKDILARTPVTEKASVKHILLGWTDVHPPGDDKGAKRSRKELEALVKKTLARLKKGEAIEPIMKELSEDPGSAESGMAYPVDAAARLVPPFKNLSLRLNVNEVGVVKSDFGIHIIKRVE
ncbi:MAG TPA: peptidylprolyl isomerase [Kofleriaceae bacterium]|nr:peptidylprolyl isomerase [Kofleriaceae bacterium]